jgi:mercuric reductase
VDHRVIPRTIFTDPEVAVVGMSEQEVIAAGHRCWCNTLPMSLVPRAGAIHDTRGIVKMVADAGTSEVLGVAIVGRNAGEVIHEAAMAMKFQATLEDFIDLVHVSPSMAEVLKIVVISRFKNPRNCRVALNRTLLAHTAGHAAHRPEWLRPLDVRFALYCSIVWSGIMI